MKVWLAIGLCIYLQFLITRKEMGQSLALGVSLFTWGFLVAAWLVANRIQQHFLDSGASEGNAGLAWMITFLGLPFLYLLVLLGTLGIAGSIRKRRDRTRLS